MTRKTRTTAEIDQNCAVCNNLLGPLGLGETTTHRFCGWATPDDWRALQPWLKGTLYGVTMGNE